MANLNYKRTIRNLKGEEFPKPIEFLTREEIEKLPKIDNPNDPKGPKIPDVKKLEKETVGDVILNCLATHRCENKKEGFYVQMIAQHVIDPKGELKEKLRRFLIEVLEDSILRYKVTKDKDGNETKEQIGVYAGWILAQVFTELGVEPED